MKKCKTKQGVALVTVMCFVAILGVLLAVIMQSAGTHMKIARSQVDIEKALYVAEAGAEYAVAHIVSGGTVPATLYGTIGDGVYCVAIINGETLGDSPHTIAGEVNINPNNSPQNEFTLTLEGGVVITRDNLVQDFSGYTGDAISVHVKPKGNGNQNGLIVDGEPYDLSNANTYDVVSGYMTVNLYNDNINKQGKAVGKWWIAIATTCAEVTISE
ncbi:PilX N-terminal domain-containing pilus assembly protein [Verrucomicrobiota bacterium]